MYVFVCLVLECSESGFRIAKSYSCERRTWKQELSICLHCLSSMWPWLVWILCPEVPWVNWFPGHSLPFSIVWLVIQHVVGFSCFHFRLSSCPGWCYHHNFWVNIKLRWQSLNSKGIFRYSFTPPHPFFEFLPHLCWESISAVSGGLFLYVYWWQQVVKHAGGTCSCETKE